MDENRICVLQFPYSDPDTIPELIPPHVRAKPCNLPKEMNSFLCQLLEVKKRPLFSWLPMPNIEPKVRKFEFYSFSMFPPLLLI